MNEEAQKIPKCKWCGVFYRPDEKGSWKPQCSDKEEVCLLEKKEIDEELNDKRTPEEMKGVMCDYCSDFKGQKFIPNPNGIGKRWWICVTCEKIIKEQQKLSFGEILKGMKDGFSKEYGDKLSKEAQEKIDDISYESGIPTFSMKIEKDKDGKYKAEVKK